MQHYPTRSKENNASTQFANHLALSPIADYFNLEYFKVSASLVTDSSNQLSLSLYSLFHIPQVQCGIGQLADSIFSTFHSRPLYTAMKHMEIATNRITEQYKFKIKRKTLTTPIKPRQTG